MIYTEKKYKALNDKKEVQELIRGFIFAQSNESFLETLENFSIKKGSGIEFMSFIFIDEIDESFSVYGTLEENQVLLTADYPAANEDCEACLSFTDFYQYLENGFNKLTEEFPDRYNEENIRKALKKLKEVLEIKE